MASIDPVPLWGVGACAEFLCKIRKSDGHHIMYSMGGKMLPVISDYLAGLVRSIEALADSGYPVLSLIFAGLIFAVSAYITLT